MARSNLPYTYTFNETLPVERLVWQVDPDHVHEWLEADFDVWTLGEAFGPGVPQLAFTKEVWLDPTEAGKITRVLVWSSLSAWQSVGRPELQKRLREDFSARFPYKVTLIEGAQFNSLRRWSRFEPK